MAVFVRTRANDDRRGHGHSVDTDPCRTIEIRPDDVELVDRALVACSSAPRRDPDVRLGLVPDVDDRPRRLARLSCRVVALLPPVRIVGIAEANLDEATRGTPMQGDQISKQV